MDLINSQDSGQYFFLVTVILNFPDQAAKVRIII